MARVRLPKLTFWRGVFIVILLAGLYSAVLRFIRGLGASTALSDNFPWGLWIGFDVLCGVALAAGGFTISAVVYIFHIDRFRPIIRPTILTAFLGYILVVVALLFDLGLPYRIWHPLVMWNPHSVMFEVAWCVMLYTTVLALEFSPILFEKLRMERLLKILHSVTVPLVILGVILSCLHQSSLGSLYLIVPHKLSPLWYSPLLPVFFFISAIALGCAMTIFESFLSLRAFRKSLELRLLADIGKVMAVVLAVYVVLRGQDLAGRNLLRLVFAPTYESRMFLAEILLGAIAPIILILVPQVRRNQLGLFIASVMVVLGFIMDRLNVSITGMEASSGVSYFPSWTELSVTAMIIAGGFVLFGLAVKHLPIFPEGELSKAFLGKAAELPAAAVLRQPMMSATTLSLAIGAVLMAAVLGIMYSGLRLHTPPQTQQFDTRQEANIAAGLAAFQMPEDIHFAKGAESLGQVVWHHSTHVNLSPPNCATCHSQRFSIMKTRFQTAAGGAPQDMHSEQKCGSCHNGRQAFDVKEDCAMCHSIE